MCCCLCCSLGLLLPRRRLLLLLLLLLCGCGCGPAPSSRAHSASDERSNPRSRRRRDLITPSRPQGRRQGSAFAYHRGHRGHRPRLPGLLRDGTPLPKVPREDGRAARSGEARPGKTLCAPVGREASGKQAAPAPHAHHASCALVAKAEAETKVDEPVPDSLPVLEEFGSAVGV